MSFTEANTVEAQLRDLLAGVLSARPAQFSPGLARVGNNIAGLGWHYVAPADLPRRPQEVLVEPYLRDALIRLNPEIAANPGRADDVLYRLRAIVLGARSDGLVNPTRPLAPFSRAQRLPKGEHKVSTRWPAVWVRNLLKRWCRLGDSNT